MVPVGYVETAEFANLGFLTKSLYFSAWVKIILAKYVSAWLLAEGAVILSGLAYNGRWEDGSVKWNGGIYITAIGVVEFSSGGVQNWTDFYLNTMLKRNY